MKFRAYKNLRCPQCECDDELRIEVRVFVELRSDDNLYIDENSHMGAGSESSCQCAGCGYINKLHDFEVPS